MIETTQAKATPDRLLRWAAIFLFGLAILALALAVIAGPGYRAEMVPLSTSFALLPWAAWTGIVVGLLAVVGLVLAMIRSRLREAGLLAVAVIVCGSVALSIRGLQSDAQAYPPIHDVTTNLADPPQFVAIPPRVEDPLRVPARTPEMEALSPQERWRIYHERAYGDLSSLALDMTPAEALDAAEGVARDMGWEIVAAEPETGRLEATATTAWFGFKDDVVVRIRPGVSGGSLVDVRSVSRIGVSDLGANAKRIREFLDRLEAAVDA